MTNLSFNTLNPSMIPRDSLLNVHFPFNSSPWGQSSSSMPVMRNAGPPTFVETIDKGKNLIDVIV
jgi:hypothetical protein